MLSRFIVIIFTLLSQHSFAATETDTTSDNNSWATYPNDLPQFDYSAELLQQNWPLLTQATFIEFPSEENLRNEALKYPKLLEYATEQAQQADAHPALKAAAQDNFAPMATAVQNIWRLHFQGNFEQAYRLGQNLGPAGLIPALYSRLMHTALIEQDADKRLEAYREISALSEELLPMAPDHAFSIFGLAYAHARELELLSTPAAAATNYLSKTRDMLDELQQDYPKRALYPAMLGGLHAGVVERVGSFIGSMTYGSSESGALEEFGRALALESGVPVILNEYATALIRLDEDDYQKEIRQVLTLCTQLPVYSAEEALNQQACQNKLSVQLASE